MGYSDPPSLNILTQDILFEKLPKVYVCVASIHALLFFLSLMKTISFTFAISWPILFSEMLTEDCPSLDAAPVPAYWMLRRRQPP